MGPRRQVAILWNEQPERDRRRASLSVPNAEVIEDERNPDRIVGQAAGRYHDASLHRLTEGERLAGAGRVDDDTDIGEVRFGGEGNDFGTDRRRPFRGRCARLDTRRWRPRRRGCNVRTATRRHDCERGQKPAGTRHGGDLSGPCGEILVPFASGVDLLIQDAPMSYVVLARKWRPMTFADLVGQSHVSRTLNNAIASGRVAHAFLFTGVRGVGKTTAARILAKALNCMGPDGDSSSGPRAEPCLECVACREIATGVDVDVREIDGASYNGVDEVRKLQDSLPYRPSRDRYKIFIVDEVHMLSQSAWNAFLKTLEEPPPHVKFIFATTEVHKVPVTILSRVQRFDFKLIPSQLIASRLRHVLAEERIDADDEAVSIIAREAAGSMRDAMSLLDQVIAWNDQRLDGESVSRVLGVASRKVLHDLARALVDGDSPGCLRIVADLANQGFDIGIVTRDILALLRDLVVAKVCPSPGDLLDLADDERADVAALAEQTDADDLVRLHQAFSTAFDDVVRGGQPRASLEMLLVRLARRPPLLPIDDLVARLGALERRLGRAPPAASGSSSGGRGGPNAPRTDPAPQRRSQAQQGDVVISTSDGSPEGDPSPSPKRPRDPATPPSGEPAHPSGRQGRALGDSLSIVGAPDPSRSQINGHTHHGQRGGASPPSASTPSGALDVWRCLVDLVANDRPELAALLTHASPIEVSRERVVVGIESGNVFEKNVTSAETREALACAAEKHFTSAVEIAFATVTKAGETLSVSNNRERTEQRREAVERAKTHPFLRQVESVLGARLKEIRLADE
jgi:DNA polymerase-3 subunit gamma/tau